MLALVIEYSKLMLLFVLIGSVVTLSRLARAESRHRLPSGDRTSSHCKSAAVATFIPLVAAKAGTQSLSPGSHRSRLSEAHVAPTSDKSDVGARE